MSHSDSEVKDAVMERVRRLKKQLHIEFKAKRKLTTYDIRQLKKKLNPVYQELKLIEAVNTHHTDEVRRLLESGVDANVTDNEKRSGLHIACSKGYADIVELLLRHGANPNQRDMIQNTPLHLAACIHNYPIISMLINAKADVHSLDSHGRNPFQLASSKLQMLQRGWRQGAIEMIKLREELQQVVDLLLSILMRDHQDTPNRVTPSDVNDLQLVKLSLTSERAEELDNTMSKLLTDIEKFTIT